MQPKSIYISSAEPRAGSLIIALGLMEMLKARYKRVAFFRPIISSKKYKDSDIEFILQHFDLDMKYEDCYGFTAKKYVKAYAQERDDELCKALMQKFVKLQEEYDFVLIEGYHRSLFSASFDFDINLKIARNLGSSFVPVLNAQNKGVDEIVNEIQIMDEVLEEEECLRLATVVNRCDMALINKVNKALTEQDGEVYILPEVKELDKPTIGEVKESLNATLLMGSKNQLEHIVHNKKIAAMGIENYLTRISKGSLVIVPGDRIDIIFASLLSFYAKNHTNIAGIVLSGDFVPSEFIMELLKDFGKGKLAIPILSYKGDSYEAAMALDRVEAVITAQSTRKIAQAKGIFDKYIDKEVIKNKFRASSSSVVTPMMFEYKIFEQARSIRQRIVLPESDDKRILRATDILIKRDIVDIILIGNKESIQHKEQVLGLDIHAATIIDPDIGELREEFAQKFYEMRKAKGLTIEAARDTMMHPNYFATMMVQEGLADGMVSGAMHTTSDTIRPALQIIKTKENTSIVSSIFFMCLETKVLIYGDCAVNLNPTSEELAQIAISSADTAKEFGIEPRVALLSYSTGSSGSGPEVEKVRQATQIAQSLRPDLLIEGPIQYDAAIDKQVAQKKLPNSQVAGEATLFIFPDLNTGNNTYKAVQRSTGALAIGPVLQGLRLPVNDLSRGCLIDDIVNTVAITAIQAQHNSLKG